MLKNTLDDNSDKRDMFLLLKCTLVNAVKSLKVYYNLIRQRESVLFDTHATKI